MRSFIDIVEERGNVKRFNPSLKIQKEELKKILELAGRTPSGWNLQHWKFVVFESEVSKEKLLPIAYNQLAIVESSAVIAVMADRKADKNFDFVYDPLVKQGLMSEDIKERIRSQVTRSYNSPENALEHAFTNAGMAAVSLSYAAESYGYDTGIIGGFDKEMFMSSFDLSDRYEPIVLIPIGRKSEYPHKSYRFPVDKTSIWL